MVTRSKGYYLMNNNKWKTLTNSGKGKEFINGKIKLPF